MPPQPWRHRSHGSLEAPAPESWPLLVDELAALWQRGAHLSASHPDSLARALAEAEERASDGEALRERLLRLPPPAGGARLELQLRAPQWRLEAACPEGAAEGGGALPCTVRVGLPAAYPLEGLGDAQLAAPGALGREAARLASRAAQATLAQLPAGCEQLGRLVDWVESTELHELAAAAMQPARGPEPARAGRVRAFVRFHHVQSVMKRGYLGLWAADLGVAALLAAGQPAMLLVEGPRSAVSAYLDCATKVLHWGPTPARLVGSAPVVDDGGESLPEGLTEVADLFPASVTPGGTYNGRDSIDFAALADALAAARHAGAAGDLRALLATAFAHASGRVQEAADGSGWVGYAAPEPELARPAEGAVKAPARRRWGR